MPCFDWNLIGSGFSGFDLVDYVAVLKRAFKRFNSDHRANIAAALAYYAFLAIPSTLLVSVGNFGLVGGGKARGLHDEHVVRYGRIRQCSDPHHHVVPAGRR